MVLLWEVHGRLITEKELEDYVTNCPTRNDNKIGNKKQAIEAVRNLGWCEKYTIEEMKAAFDNDPKLVGSKIGGIEVLNADELAAVLAGEPAELAILALPAEHAAEIAATLVACEIKGILNFAPTTLSLGGNIAVVNVDLASELQRLAFAVQSQKS